MNIGEKIKNARESKMLTTRQLAEKITKSGTKMSQSTISKIENNKRKISIPELLIIAHALGMPMSALATISIEEKTNDLMGQRNISVEDMIKKTGLKLNELPVGDKEFPTRYQKETLYKVSNALNITFDELIKNTNIEDLYKFSPEQNLISEKIAYYINKERELEQINPSQRRKIDHISINTMAILLDTTESEIKTFENEYDKYPKMNLKYIDVLKKIEIFEEKLLKIIFNSHHIDLKELLNLTPSEIDTLISILISNINNLIPEIKKLSSVSLNNKIPKK